jgi:hypothetical protein
LLLSFGGVCHCWSDRRPRWWTKWAPPVEAVSKMSYPQDLISSYAIIFLWVRQLRYIFCLFVYSCMSNISAIWQLSPLPVTGPTPVCLALMDFSSEGSFTCHTYYDTGPRFIWSHPKEKHTRQTVDRWDLGTDIRLRFSKHPLSYIQYFWKPYTFYFRWKSWPNLIFHNNIVTCLYIVDACAKLEDKFQQYKGMLNYLPIDITDWWKLHPIDIFDWPKKEPIPAVRLCIPRYKKRSPGPLTTRMGMQRTCSNPDTHGANKFEDFP